MLLISYELLTNVSPGVIIQLVNRQLIHMQVNKY